MGCERRRLTLREWAFAILALAGATLGCGGASNETRPSGAGGAQGGTGGAGTSGVGTGGTGGSAMGLCDRASGPVDLSGQWAVLASLTVELIGNPAAIVKLCPDPQKQSASFLLKVTLAGSGTSYTETVTVCDLSMPKVTGGVGSCPSDPTQYIETRIEPGNELKAYLPTRDVSNVPVALPGSDAGTPFAPEPFSLVLGANLANAATDPLPFWDAQRVNCGTVSIGPTPASCVNGIEKIIVEDSDQHLGVTLLAEATDANGAKQLEGAAYAVLRVSPMLNGTVQNSSCIDGGLNAKLEYSIVDSSIRVLGLATPTPSVIEQLPPFAATPESHFQMLRADGTGESAFDDDGNGSVSCAEIRNHQAAFTP